MKDRNGTRWARAVSLATVFLCVLLAPLLVAQAANAADPKTIDELQKLGGSSACDSVGCLKFAALGQNHYSDGSAGQYLGLKVGSPAPNMGTDSYNRPQKNIGVCWLSSRDGLVCQNAPIIGTKATGGASDACNNTSAPVDNCSSVDYWVYLDNAARFSGLICASIDPANYCGMGTNTALQRGEATQKDIGYLVSVGKDPAGSDTLPGQKTDGSVDPIECIKQSLADATGQQGGAFDPIGYIFTPVKCAFLWATTMPTTGLTDLVNGQTGRWNKTQLGATVNSVDFFSAFQGDSSCSGLTVPLSGFRTAGGPSLQDMHLLRSCNGAQLETLAGLVKLGLTVTILLGGAFKIVRMISAFIKGPKLDTDEHGSVTLF